MRTLNIGLNRETAAVVALSHCRGLAASRVRKSVQQGGRA